MQITICNKFMCLNFTRSIKHVYLKWFRPGLSGKEFKLNLNFLKYLVSYFQMQIQSENIISCFLSISLLSANSWNGKFIPKMISLNVWLHICWTHQFEFLLGHHQCTEALMQIWHLQFCWLILWPVCCYQRFEHIQI